MKLTLFSVGGPDRTWSDWLDAQVLEGPVTVIFDSRSYEKAGRFLVLIHLGNELPDNEEIGLKELTEKYAKKWSDLGETKSKVWWLFYSGSGYHRIRSQWPNIHLLRYPVGRAPALDQNIVGEDLALDKRNCFRALIENLKTEGQPKSDQLWELLYPPGSLKATSLLALLCAAQHNVDIAAAVQLLLTEDAELREAYKEWEMWAHRVRTGPGLAFEEWKILLRRGDYKTIRDELRTVLGAVPD